MLHSYLDGVTGFFIIAAGFGGSFGSASAGGSAKLKNTSVPAMLMTPDTFLSMTQIHGSPGFSCFIRLRSMRVEKGMMLPRTSTPPLIWGSSLRTYLLPWGSMRVWILGRPAFLTGTVL